ncbi:MAG: ribonuclease P protein component [bacterium]
MTIKSLSSTQIALIMKKGRAYNSGFFLLKVFEKKETGPVVPKDKVNQLEGSFVCSKKVCIKAIDRNKSKRRLREAFVTAIKELGLEDKNTTIPSFVFLSKETSKNAGFGEIVSDIKQILVKEDIIKQ